MHLSIIFMHLKREITVVDISRTSTKFFFFLVDRRNGKAIINSHTQVEVPGFEPWSWRPA